MGRRKLEMKQIEDKSSKQLTFSKRRSCLFKKARHLSILCDVDVAVVVISAHGKLYEFSSDGSGGSNNRNSSCSVKDSEHVKSFYRQRTANKNKHHQNPSPESGKDAAGEVEDAREVFPHFNFLFLLMANGYFWTVGVFLCGIGCGVTISKIPSLLTVPPTRSGVPRRYRAGSHTSPYHLRPLRLALHNDIAYGSWSTNMDQAIMKSNSLNRLEENNTEELSVTDMMQLELELNDALVQTRLRKTQLMREHLSTLQEEQRKLREGNEEMEKQAS